MPFGFVVGEIKVCVGYKQFGCSMPFGYGVIERKVFVGCEQLGCSVPFGYGADETKQGLCRMQAVWMLHAIWLWS